MPYQSHTVFTCTMSSAECARDSCCPSSDDQTAVRHVPEVTHLELDESVEALGAGASAYSLYFFDDPRTRSAGYFSPLRCNLRCTAAGRSMSHLSASRIRYLREGWKLLSSQHRSVAPCVAVALRHCASAAPRHLFIICVRLPTSCAYAIYMMHIQPGESQVASLWSQAGP